MKKKRKTHAHTHTHTHTRRHRYSAYACVKNAWKNKIVWNSPNDRDKRFYLSKRGNFQLGRECVVKISRLYLLLQLLFLLFPFPSLSLSLSLFFHPILAGFSASLILIEFVLPPLSRCVCCYLKMKKKKRKKGRKGKME